MNISIYATFALAFLVFASSPGPDNVTILSKTVTTVRPTALPMLAVW